MNTMDLLPLDIPSAAVQAVAGTEAMHHTYLRWVPTADVNTTFAMSITVFLLIIYYSIKAKGGWGFTKELFTAPFHAEGTVATIVLAIPNLFLNLVEYLSMPVSLGMRLFGNMYAGEPVFMLIAGLFASWFSFSPGVILSLIHIYNLLLKRYVHVGFAADTPNGLVVPVLRDADQKGVAQIAKEMGELAALARDGKLKPDQMQGGCFTISSLGGIGGTAFTPIINAPEVAILGVSKSEIKPVWDGKTFQPKLCLLYTSRCV